MSVLASGRGLRESREFFVRGDANSSGTIDLSDAIRILGFLFLGSPPPSCMDAADADDNGTVEITDAIRILKWLFSGGAPPASPAPGGPEYSSEDCDEDPTADDDIGCAVGACE